MTALPNVSCVKVIFAWIRVRLDVVLTVAFSVVKLNSISIVAFGKNADPNVRFTKSMIPVALLELVGVMLDASKSRTNI